MKAMAMYQQTQGGGGGMGMMQRGGGMFWVAYIAINQSLSGIRSIKQPNYLELKIPILYFNL